jgi:hypothetical protein
MVTSPARVLTPGSILLGGAEHSSVMSKVLVSSYIIGEGDLGSRFDERTGLSKT